MDVFDLHQTLVGDYSNFVTSFHAIKDERIQKFVDDELSKGLLWPKPLLQLNPRFKPGASIDDLCDEGLIHSKCKSIFRFPDSDNPLGSPMRLHAHQEQAVRISQKNEPYVLTTGTGSGKSLTYIIPIVNHVLQQGSGNGIQAILVYPMNALANSQMEELDKYLQEPSDGSPRPVTFARYTGQEKEAERKAVLENPPDILITNYMMLELMLTRPEERKLVECCQGLHYLVLDELHTYRGRQGADVAFLMRRCQEYFNKEDMIFVGTSATMASEDDAMGSVADVASKIFGQKVPQENVIGETLQQVSSERDWGDPAVVVELKKQIESGLDTDADFDTQRSSPLASWIEFAFGLERNDFQQLVRRTPRSIEGENGGAAELAALTETEPVRAEEAIRQFLELSSRLEDPQDPTGRSRLFAFRLHQFISRGDTVWSTFEPEADRSFVTRGQVYLPDSDSLKRVFPVAFCKDCGQEYYRIDRPSSGSAEMAARPRLTFDQSSEADWESGYLYLSSENPFPSEPVEVRERLPESWLELDRRGNEVIKRSFRDRVPEPVVVDPAGVIHPEGHSSGTGAAWISGNFRFCLNPECGVSYPGTLRSDVSKLRTLGVDGRSTATTLFAISVLRRLCTTSELPEEARKLLSFTDNRQDAALQAGHFNDFVRVASVRSALLTALQDGDSSGIRSTDLPEAIFDGLDVPTEEYARDPAARGLAREDAASALRRVLEYHVYRDLERGWRINTPNLEQCGLLAFDYRGLADCSEDDEVWAGNSTLAQADHAVRKRLCRVLLDLLRKNLCILNDRLRRIMQERFSNESRQHLSEMWAISEEDERDGLLQSRYALAGPRPRGGRGTGNLFPVSGRSAFARYAKSPQGLGDLGQDLTTDDLQQIVDALFDGLCAHGLLVRGEEENQLSTYQLKDDVILWQLGSGSPVSDPLREESASSAREDVETGNQFFRQFYQTYSDLKLQLEGREHTAQVPSEIREDREDRFRRADLPLLFCSPTMELGVDISRLNVVNLRNVPPTPANYAQRSGRAGRNGDPALVYTYCSGWSPHDQYYFRQPEKMVAGKVLAPSIELCNEDLVRSHIQAIWLYESRQSLGKTLGDVLSVSEEDLNCPLQEHISNKLTDRDVLDRAAQRSESVLSELQNDLEQTDWFGSDWIRQELGRVKERFEEACRRWRSLFRSAVDQRNFQHRVVGDHSRPEKERVTAKRLRAHAEAQVSLLTEARGVYEGDFYSYRYFASEGFLPGYNFPRLPVTAFIPGRRNGRGRDEFLSRPRFLAISEFGPRALIYHEGRQYCIADVNLGMGNDEDQILPRVSLKNCPQCGCIHEVVQAPGPDVCEMPGCGASLGNGIDNAVRIEGVRARPQRRISSEQEERTRIGYDLLTGFSFQRTDGTHVVQQSSAKSSAGENLLQLDYGENAKLWRLNLGWRSRRNDSERGFRLNVEKGRWERNQDDPQQEAVDGDDPQSDRIERVVPFVEDHRNSLSLRLEGTNSLERYATLLSALKVAIQQEYQIEPREITGELLPNDQEPSRILLIEQAEGGAGVLRQIWKDAGALPRLARRALEICHFDPDTGEDLAGKTTVSCQNACYDCLLSYENQRHHEWINRHEIKELLQQLAGGSMEVSSVSASREQQMELLNKKCDSQLERQWLQALEEQGLHIPTHAQELLGDHSVRPDFEYRDRHTLIFIDGPPHDTSEQKKKDEAITNRLEDAGYLVLRFHHSHSADWNEIFSQNPSIFGRPSS